MTTTGAVDYGSYTEDDLEVFREADDRLRYELVDGELLVSPSPRYLHQAVVGELHLLLRATMPRHLQVLFAPFDVRLARDTVLEPDLVVARRSDFGERNLATAPLLAIEVLSPSTRRADLSLKKDRLERAGCPSYWVVDADVPSLVAWELRDGRYAEAARLSGDQRAELVTPWRIEVCPAELVR